MHLHRRALLKQCSLGFVGLSIESSFPLLTLANETSLDGGLSRSSLDSQGVSSQGILQFLAAAAKANYELHSLMVTRHGCVVAEGWWAPYRRNAVHSLYSVSKSFVSTAIGFAVAEGILKLSDSIVRIFPDKLPRKITANLATLNVKQLLTMSVGHAKDPIKVMTQEEDWVRAFLLTPIERAPGSEFVYNSGATYMLSAIIQKLSGQVLIDYLEPRLFRPLEIKDKEWERCPLGINTGGWGLSLTTESLAKFGQFYLQGGFWNGRQILPQSWIEEATQAQIQQTATWSPITNAHAVSAVDTIENLQKTSDFYQGYGYQFWRCRHSAYRALGAFGQHCIVLPEQDAVITITSRTTDNQADLLNLVWEHILPAMRDGDLRDDMTSNARLKRELAAPALSVPAGSGVHGAVEKKALYRLEPNSLNAEEVTFRFHNESCTFCLKTSEGMAEITCAMGKWMDSITTMPGTPPKFLTVSDVRPVKVAAAGWWKNENTFEMQWRFYETPHYDTVVCHFERNLVTIEFRNSISEYSKEVPETRPILRGHMSA